MSLANYTALQAAIADWLDRSDAGVLARIPDFIQLAESTLNKVIRSRYMATNAAIAFTAGVNRASLPTGLIDIIYVANSTAAGETLAPKPSDFIAHSLRVRLGTPGTPVFYCVIGGDMLLAPPPLAAKTYTVDYYQEIPPLASNATNWLLTHYPDLYLNMALFYASPYMRDDERAALFQSSAMQQVQALVNSNNALTLEGSAFDTGAAQ